MSPAEQPAPMQCIIGSPIAVAERAELSLRQTRRVMQLTAQLLISYYFPTGIVTMTPGAPGAGCWLGLCGGLGMPGTVPGVTIPGRIVV
jgi:hypothetical protein